MYSMFKLKMIYAIYSMAITMMYVDGDHMLTVTNKYFWHTSDLTMVGCISFTYISIYEFWSFK